MLGNYDALAKKLISSKIIGLGESLHNTPVIHKEITLAVTALLNTGRVHSILLENPLWKTNCIDHWISGESKSAVRVNQKHLYKIWNTKEFLNLLSALRSYNSKPRREPVRLIGFDIRQPDFDYKILHGILPGSSNRRLRSTHTFKLGASWKSFEVKCLEGDRNSLKLARSDFRKVSSIKRHALPRAAMAPLKRVLAWLEYLSVSQENYGKSLRVRDQQMFREVAKYLSTVPKDRIVIIIGHAVHLMLSSANAQSASYDFRMEEMLGQRLKKEFGKSYSYVHFTASGRAFCLAPVANSVEGYLSVSLGSQKRYIGNVKALHIPKGVVKLSEFELAPMANRKNQQSSVFGLKFDQSMGDFYISFRKA